MKKADKRRIFALLIVVLTVTLGITGYTYINNGYAASDAALAVMAGAETVCVYEPTENMVVFAAEEPAAGMVFYPGGKVEHTAYAPLMQALAEAGITCVLTEMPFDLAVLDVDAAQRAREAVTGIERWYIGGHSLGGAMAANYAAAHPDEYDGLILLAAYSTKDLKYSGLKVVSLYGTEDKILNREKYEKYWENLPENAVELVLDGGNHAQFGSYGPQDGDGTARVSAEKQTAWTAEIISSEILG